jgi:hypothetical protein
MARLGSYTPTCAINHSHLCHQYLPLVTTMSSEFNCSQAGLPVGSYHQMPQDEDQAPLSQAHEGANTGPELSWQQLEPESQAR